MDERRADDLASELSRVAGDPFEIALKGVGAFGDNHRSHTLWAGVETPNDRLSVLAGRCRAAGQRAGVAMEARDYRPHVTLAYLRRPNPGDVAKWIQENNLLRTEPFRVTSFGLYSSWQSDQRSWYRMEREYPLY